MGSFSIWHWLIVFLYIAITVVPIAIANPRKTLPRSGYARRTGISFLVLIAVWIIVGSLGGFWPVIGVITGWTIAPFFILWSAHRAQDIGWSKWLCLLFLVPFANIFVWLVLLIRRRRESGGEEGVASAAG